MSIAIAVNFLTPADLETRLGALGIPVARLIAAAHIARSTWSAWRTGRTRPRSDRWAAATEAFAALVAKAEAAQPERPAESGGADVVPLTGSSPPTGAPPGFTPVATAPAPVKAPIAPDPDAEVIDLAGRLAALVLRQDRVLGRAFDLQGRIDRWDLGNRPAPPAERASRMVSTDLSTATHRIMQFSESLADLVADRREAEAYAAACKAHGRLKRRKVARTRQPYLQKLAERMWNRIYRWAVALTGMEPLTSDGLAAKSAAAVAVLAVAREEEWGRALSEAANRDAVRLAGGPAASSYRVNAGPTDADAGILATIARSEGPAFAAIARHWARNQVHLTLAIEAGSAPEGTLDELADVVAAHRSTFLDTPARTMDGVLAKSLVLATYIQDQDDPLPECFQALRDATRNTEEARYAFPVMQDLGAMLTEQGFTVEALAALPAGDVEAEQNEVARLTAEWVRTSSLDGRDKDAVAEMLPSAFGAPGALDVFQANAREHIAVLHRIAALRSTSPDVLALKAAAVLAGCRDVTGLDDEILREGGPDINSGDLIVALSLVRNVAALFPDRVSPLVAAANAAAALPTIDRSAASVTPTRSAA